MSTATTRRYDTSRHQAPGQVTEHSPALLRFTFANPPINLFDPDVYAELRLLVDRMETDPELRVVIFDSADPDYFISHLDVKRLTEVPDRPGAAGLSDTWHDFVTRLAHAPVLSIASIRGRSRGIGNEFTLACDLRFASREKALMGQLEIGFGVVPGGGAFDWLPRLVGRSRALEIEERLGLLAGQALAVTAAVPGAGRLAGWPAGVCRACSRSPRSFGLAGLTADCPQGTGVASISRSSSALAGVARTSAARRATTSAASDASATRPPSSPSTPPASLPAPRQRPDEVLLSGQIPQPRSRRLKPEHWRVADTPWGAWRGSQHAETRGQRSARLQARAGL
jgi:enoyl-CoA hydratase/carnithine racemase